MSGFNQFGNNATIQTVINERRNDAAIVDALRRDITFAKLLPQTISATPSAVDKKVNIVLVISASLAITITLPPAIDMINRLLYVKDISGNAAANNITVDADGAETIDGAATSVISSNYGIIMLYCNGENWYKL